MAVTWGNWSSNNRLRCGMELSMSPSTVSDSTTSVTITIKVYLQSRYYSHEETYNQNNWYISGDLVASGMTGWNFSGGMQTKLMATRSISVSTSTSGSITKTFSDYIISRGAYPGTRATGPQLSITIPKRPAPVQPPASSPPTTPPPPPPPAIGGWCLYTKTAPAPAAGKPISLTAQWRPTGFTFSGQATIVRWSWANVTITESNTLRAFGLVMANDAGMSPDSNYRVTASYDPNRTPKAIVTVNDTVYTNNSAAVPDYLVDAFMVGGRYHNDYTYTDAAGGRYSHAAYWNRALSQDEMLSIGGDQLLGPGLKADERINTILDYVGWPANRRLIDPALDGLNRDSWSDGTSVYSLIQKWVQSDGGIVFADGAGNIVFKNRHARVNNTVHTTLDFKGSTSPEAGLNFIMDEADIRNVIDLNVLYGIKGSIRDEASVTAYGERPYSIELDIQDDNVGMDAAQDALNKYAKPIIRVEGLSVFPSSAESDTLWTAILTAEIGQVIRLTNMPDTAPAPTMDFYIESIDHNIQRQGERLVWVTQFSVSPCFPNSGFILDSPTLGVLDSTATLAY